MKQRIFKIREHLLSGKKKPVLDDVFDMSEATKPIPDVVWMRYNLTLRAMDKRFATTDDLFDYVVELEDFIYSALSPGIQEHMI